MEKKKFPFFDILMKSRRASSSLACGQKSGAGFHKPAPEQNVSYRRLSSSSRMARRKSRLVTVTAGVSPSHRPARSLVMVPPSMTAMEACSSLSAKAWRAAMPSSSPRFRRAPVQAKRVAMGLVEVSLPWRCW